MGVYAGPAMLYGRGCFLILPGPAESANPETKNRFVCNFAALSPIKNQITLLFNRKELKEHRDNPGILRLFFSAISVIFAVNLWNYFEA